MTNKLSKYYHKFDIAKRPIKRKLNQCYNGSSPKGSENVNRFYLSQSLWFYIRIVNLTVSIVCLIIEHAKPEMSHDKKVWFISPT